MATREQEAIYGFFVLNRREERQPWFFRGWLVESARDLLEGFTEPPGYVTYTDDPGDYYYNWHRELNVSVRHLVKDKQIDRLRTAQRH
ncbi:DUF3825 domain-containing protein [Streptomyces sp. NPDC005953]|uniref:DUF3825 domain-containing protein n=1 Tax=Streptomyces sp. NPDC005953 TaxID=3156719 RepID=UPI0033C00524